MRWFFRIRPKKFPPKKFPAIKFPKMTIWDKKFPVKKFPPKKFPAIKFPKLTHGPKSFRPKSFQNFMMVKCCFINKLMKQCLLVYSSMLFVFTIPLWLCPVSLGLPILFSYDCSDFILIFTIYMLIYLLPSLFWKLKC